MWIALSNAMTAMLTASAADRNAQAIELATYVKAHFTVCGMVDGIVDGYRAALSRRSP